MPLALSLIHIYEQIHDITKIDFWFIDKLAILVEMEDALKAVGAGEKSLTAELLAEAKRIEYPDNVIARLTEMCIRDSMTAEYLLLSSWTLRRALSPVIHRECPAKVAVLPSSVMAYFMITRGRPVFM